MMDQVGSTRVLIADDHPVVRFGLNRAVSAESGMTVVGEADSVASTLDALAKVGCDVIVFDLMFKGLDGLEGIKTLQSQHPEVAILVFSVHDELQFAERCIRHGARGYLMKGVATNKVINAIRAIARGKVAVSPAVAQRVMAQGGQGGARRLNNGLDSLSDRELEVLSLLGTGLSTREIAKQLHLSVKTIDTYRDNLKHKLGLENATRLIRFAVQYAIDSGIG